MARFFSTLLLAAPLALAAQEVVTLDQSLAFSYNGSRASLGDIASTSALTRADYRFDVGMPILAYRLGAINVGGTLGYVKQSNDDASDSTVGLNTVGFQGMLFPYQPYHLTFDYGRSTSPNLFGDGTQVGQSYGLGLVYRGYRIQDLRIAYRHGSTSGAVGSGEYTAWSLSDTERRGNTDIRISADRQEASYGHSLPWRSTSIAANARTYLSRDWSLNTSTFASMYQTSSAIQAGSNLVGNLGDWTSMSALDARYSDFQSQAQRAMSLSQSLAHTWGRFSAFTQLGFSSGTSSGASGGSSTMANATLGTSFRLSENWVLMSDVSSAWSGLTSTSGSSNVTVGNNRTTSLHVGLSWGGSLPELLTHAMFYWSDLRFQRRVEEDYPPDYIPPELAQTLVKRRTDREGQLQFSSDLYHVENSAHGHQDWFRMQGGLSFSSGLMVQTIGDWRKDDAFTDPAFQSESRMMTMFGAYGMGRTALRFGMGYSKNTTTLNGSQVQNQWLPQGASTYYSLGVDSFVAGMPCGAMLMRNNDPMGLGTTTLMTHLSTGFRKVRFSINVQRGWRSDGLRTSQITINLLRWFDTMALWGLGD